MRDALPHFSVPRFGASKDDISLSTSEIAEQKPFQVAVQREVGDILEQDFMIYGVKCLAKINRHHHCSVPRFLSV